VESEPAMSKLSRRTKGGQGPQSREGRPGRAGAPPEGAAARRARRPKSWSVAEAQAAVGEMAERMRTDLKRLKRIHAGLTPPPDLDARVEHLKPYDVTTELLGGLEHLRLTGIPDLIKGLDRMARVTDAQLEQEFEQRRACRRRAGLGEEESPAS
jgi:hypothetical protein